MLRVLVIALALLAGAKIWAQDRLYRDGAQEALIGAFLDTADPMGSLRQLFVVILAITVIQVRGQRRWVHYA